MIVISPGTSIMVSAYMSTCFALFPIELTFMFLQHYLSTTIDSVGITDTLPEDNDLSQYIKGKTSHSIKVIDGWRVLRFCRRIGHGNKCYRRLQHAVFNWAFESSEGNRLMGIIPAAEEKKAARSADTTNRLLATFTEVRFPRPFMALFVVNPVSVVKEIKDVKREKCIVSSSSYATLQGHVLAGEERVAVIWRTGLNNEVDLEIVS